MSAAATGWAWEQKLPPGQKLVLVALGQKADEDGVLWWSQTRLAKFMAMADRQVREHLGSLAERGLVTRFHRHRRNGSRTSDLIVLNMPREVALDLASYSGIVGAKEAADVDPSGPTGGFPSNLPAGSGEANRRVSAAPEQQGEEQDERSPSARSGREQESLAMEVPKRPRFTIGRTRKIVNAQEWQMVEGIVATFNEAMRLAKPLDPYERDVASRVVMVLRKEPTMTLDEHREVIRRNAAAPWWQGEPGIGVVYSPGAWPRAKVSTGTPTGRQAQERQREETWDAMTRLENMTAEEVQALGNGGGF